MLVIFGYFLNSYELMWVNISRGFAKDQVCDGQGHMFSSPSDARTLTYRFKPQAPQVMDQGLVWSGLL